MPTEINVLHIDDDSSIADLTATFLERKNDRFSVDIATSVEEGLEILSAHPPECIISDYEMPGTDGIDFLERVREDHPDLPFILYTGKGSEEVASEAISAGVTDYLQKESGTDHYSILANRITNAVAQARAEQKIERMEEYYSQILEHASDYLMIVDEQGQLTYVSPAVKRVMGYTPDELDSTNAFETIHPDDHSVASEAFSDLLEQPEQERTVEYRARHADGSWRWVEVRGRNLLDNPVIEGILVSVRDITERVEHQRKLKRQNDLFVKAQDIADVGAWEYDIETEELTWTEQVYRIHGLSNDHDPTPENAIEHYHPDDQSIIEEAFEQAVEDGTPYDVELRLITDDDEQRWVRTWGDPQTEDGETIRIRGTIQDITGRKEREREIRNQQEQSRHLEEVGEIGYWELDLRTSGPPEPVGSRGVADILDVPADEQFVLDQALEFFHPADRPTIEHAVDQLISDAEPYDLELRLTTAAGTDRWIHTTGEPVERDGEIVKVRGIIQDITQRKRQENALAEQNERLEEFASVVSHDLRNPLRVADGRLELAREECNSTHLDTVDEALTRMERIIEDVLWLAREGQDIGETSRIDLSGMVNAAWTVVADGHDDAELIVADSGSDACGPIEADGDRLRQLLENLMHNAISHGDGAVTVTVGTMEDGFYVEDDGPGIPPQDRDAVFKSGYSTAEEGTGLGLNIVSKVVDAHGWEIQVTEGTRGGARFEITDVEMLD